MILDCTQCGEPFDARLDKDGSGRCQSCRRRRFISTEEFRRKIAAALGYLWPLRPHIGMPKRELDSQQLDAATHSLLGVRRKRNGRWEKA